MIFLLLFIILPLLEIMVFIMVGREIGIFYTLLLSFLMAIIGGIIVKHQGLSKFFEVNTAFQRGEVPSKELFDGLLIVLAAGLMITPGFVTDIVGFALLIPSVRGFIRARLMDSARVNVAGFDVNFTEFYEARSKRPEDGDIIDVPYKTLHDQDKP